MVGLFAQVEFVYNNVLHRKGTETNVPRFDKQLEEFYSICDQIELNLQAAIGCASQVSSGQRHVPSQVTVVRQEPVINQ